MTERTQQADVWNGEFGRKYIERHPETAAGFDAFRREVQYGETQTELFERTIGHLDRSSRILEVGTNIGLQLRILREMGFENLYGIDVHEYAVRRCRREAPELNVVEGDALDIPFKDDFFDLVFTNETLVTIPPEHVERAMDEIVRCSRRCIWGLEHYDDEYTEIEYRGRDEMLWKTDFPGMYLDRYPVTLREREYLEFLDSDDRDVMYLLEFD